MLTVPTVLIRIHTFQQFDHCFSPANTYPSTPNVGFINISIKCDAIPRMFTWNELILWSKLKVRKTVRKRPSAWARCTSRMQHIHTYAAHNRESEWEKEKRTKTKKNSFRFINTYSARAIRFSHECELLLLLNIYARWTTRTQTCTPRTASATIAILMCAHAIHASFKNIPKNTCAEFLLIINY